MIGVIIGATAALGTCAFVHRRHHRRYGCDRGRHYYEHHGCDRGFGGHDRHHGHHGRRGGRWGGYRGGAQSWVSRIADRIDASPAQEQVMQDAVRELLDELRTIKDDAKASRSHLAEAFGDERFDEERMGELFARHDELLGSARKAVVGALTKIHDVLEPRQREQLSRWIGRRGNFGPYRM